MEYYSLLFQKNEIVLFAGKMDGTRNHHLSEIRDSESISITCFPSYVEFKKHDMKVEVRLLSDKRKEIMGRGKG